MPAARVIAVPVTSLDRAKTRLAAVLSPMERAALTLAMLEDVLDAALAQEGWETWVASSDESVLEVSARRGARAFPEAAGSLLGALHLVEEEAGAASGELAVLLADVPLVSASTLRDALALDAAVVAAPAGSDGGTNLLVRGPPLVIPARFGPNSFGRHRWAARRARVTFETVEHPELSFDVDRPDDLERLVLAGDGTRSALVCHDLGMTARLRPARRA
jgi:2-phospho-L-lactate guanylyltransferase